MYSSISKLDRDIARSFLNASTNLLSYAPVSMRSQQMLAPYHQSVYNKENRVDEVLPPYSNVQLGSNIVPMYYDMIIDTVTDYDIFYPIAKQTEKYYQNFDTITPRYQVQRLEELAVSMDFPHDTDSISPILPDERSHAIKNVRFNDHPTCIPQSKNDFLDQYYFYPTDNEQPATRYITTPFFWFRPVLDHNYAICIPTSRPSLHAYITPSFNPISSVQYPVRL